MQINTATNIYNILVSVEDGTKLGPIWVLLSGTIAERSRASQGVIFDHNASLDFSLENFSNIWS